MLYNGLDVTMPQTCMVSGAGNKETCDILNLNCTDVPQSPMSQRSDLSGQSSCCQQVDMCCSTGERPSGALAAAHLMQPTPLQTAPADKPGEGFVRMCVHCGVTKTPQWRAGPLGQKTLCNACGVRFKAGRLNPVVSYPPPGYPASGMHAMGGAVPASPAKAATGKVTSPKRKLGEKPGVPASASFSKKRQAKAAAV